MDTRQETERRLLALLADGGFQSGEALGAQLGCSRAYLWKLIRQLRDDGAQIDSVPGRGYRLGYPIELLEAERIGSLLRTRPAPAVTVFDTVPSTNRWLMEQARNLDEPTVVLAERQQAGRGRWGRQWTAPFGGALMMSLLWPFSGQEGGLGGLSLAVAVALTETLRELGAEGLSVKWPNDLLLEGRKTAGILVEVVGESRGPVKAVIGVGLNLALSQRIREQIDQPVGELATVLGPAATERNRLAAALIDSVLQACREFADHGFEQFRARWEPLDALAGKAVVLKLPGGDVEGTVRGVDVSGALVLDQEDGRRSYFTGETQLKVRQ